MAFQVFQYLHKRIVTPPGAMDFSGQFGKIFNDMGVYLRR